MAEENENAQGMESQEEPKPAEEGGGEAEQAQQAEGTPEGQVSGEVSRDARMWGMLCHLLAIFTCFIGPLIIWLIKKEEDAFIDDQGKEALNFQITVAIAGFVSFLLSFICIGFFLGAAVGICNLVFCIIASIKANGGERYRYPVALRLIK